MSPSPPAAQNEVSCGQLQGMTASGEILTASVYNTCILQTTGTFFHPNSRSESSICLSCMTWIEYNFVVKIKLHLLWKNSEDLISLSPFDI